ncbi:hypothetical protein ENUP19_0100G0010 [Entamoeba nuttalli]|uniref:Uncharacterized protein n=1 Tax=Entamoeba nuttalli TaxID=412467 RepID=A0ABQ0DHD1_9EUKA
MDRTALSINTIYCSFCSISPENHNYALQHLTEAINSQKDNDMYVNEEVKRCMIRYITRLTNKIMELDINHSTYSMLKEPNLDDQPRLSFDVLGSDSFPMLS